VKRSTPVIVLAALLVLGVLALPGQRAGTLAQGRVLVLGVDGGTWDVIVPMIEAGELPALAGLYRHGVHGILKTRPPVISPVVWSTMFTGKLPAEHGVLNWKTSHSTHRKVKATWNIASDAGLRSHVYNVPGSWPPEQVNGRMASGFPLSGSTIGGSTGEVYDLSLADPSDGNRIFEDNETAIRGAARGLEPGQWSDWFDVGALRKPALKGRMRVRKLAPDRIYATPFYRSDAGLVVTWPEELAEELRAELGQAYIPEGPGWSRHAEPDTPTFLAEHLAQVSRLQIGAAGLSIADDWQLFIYVHTLVDRVSHPYWAYMRPDDYEGMDAEKARRYGEAVPDAYRETDRQLGRLLAEIDDDVYVVVVSDHGFKSSKNRSLLIGTHDFDGIYLVAGPGIEPGDGPETNIEDVAPTLLYLLGLPGAADMVGKIFPPVVDSLGGGRLKVASYEDLQRPGNDQPVDKSTWEQLRSLGYVTGDPPAARENEAGQAR